MTHILISHQVQDFAVWKAGYDAGEATRTAYGIISAKVYQDNSDPNRITGLLEFADLKSAQAFLGDETLKADMKKAGVISAPEISFLEAI